MDGPEGAPISSKPIIEIRVLGKVLEAMIDSGSNLTYFDTKLKPLFKPLLEVLDQPIVVETADGSPISSGPIRQQALVNITHGDKEVRLPIHPITTPHAQIILGRDWLRLSNPLIDWRSLSVSYPNQPTTLATLEALDTTYPEKLQILQQLPVPYHEYWHLFSKEKAHALPPNTDADLQIEIKDNEKLPWGPIYALSQEEDAALKTYLQDMLSKGFIEPSNSEAGAPIFFVKKKSGELRPVVDYRKLNAITIKNRYPLPLIHELLSKFSSARIFTKLDLRGAYNLLRIKQGDEYKTAFRSRYGHYQYRVMPFGLCNAPAAFQEYINSVLRDLLDIFCVVYLDDILIFSENQEQHEHHVKLILQRLADNHLYCKLEKSEFSVTTTTFLGYLISDQGISMLPDRIQDVNNWPAPKNRTELQSFLGFANFYRMFVSNYSAMTAPLTSLLQKDKVFIFDQQCAKTFEKLKKAFTSAPILCHPQLNAPFILETDASDFAIGSVLSQKQKDDDLLHPVAYRSRKLTRAELNYQIHDKELLAIIDALGTWRPYLINTKEPFKIYTDHKNLQYFQSARQLNRRQARWATFLADFDFELVYRPGSEGGKPDALSRRVDFQLNEDDHKAQKMALLPPDRFVSASLEIRPSEEKTEGTLFSLIQEAQAEMPRDHDELKSCSKLGSLYYFEGRLYVPASVRTDVLNRCHDHPLAGHPGIRKTFFNCSRIYWWPRLRRDVQRYVRNCDTCARSKSMKQKPAGLLQPLEPPSRPWQALAMDFITNLPKVGKMDTILVVVDRFSKMAHFIPCQNTMTAMQLSDVFIDRVVRLHGIPVDIISDRGPLFVSQFWKFLMGNLGTNLKLSTAYHPQTDGQTERVNQTLETYLRCYSNQTQNNSLANLPLAEFAYNASYQESIRQTPFEVCYGFTPPLDPSCEMIAATPPTVQDFKNKIADNFEIIKAEIKNAAEVAKRYADSKRREVEFNVEDYCFLSTKNIRFKGRSRKLEAKYLGPFRVLEKIGQVAYRLELPEELSRIHPVFHVSLLKPCYADHRGQGKSLPALPELELDDEGYEVDAILDSVIEDGILYYFLSWRGYGPEDNSWEPAENLNCAELIQEYHSRFPTKPGSQLAATRGYLLRRSKSQPEIRREQSSIKELL